jgi:toxin ParE1/3/4
MATFELTDEADADMDSQYEYLVSGNPTAARRFYRAARQRFQQLADFPGIGAPRSARNPLLAALRMATIRGFPQLVYYLPADHGVLILRVLHGAQDVNAIFDIDKP